MCHASLASPRSIRVTGLSILPPQNNFRKKELFLNIVTIHLRLEASICYALILQWHDHVAKPLDIPFTRSLVLFLYPYAGVCP